MKAKALIVSGAILWEMDRFEDERGFFEVLYSEKSFPNFDCIQLNCSKSKKNVLRGIHTVPFNKLVHCIKGRVYDVVIDLREWTNSYLQWYGVELCEEDRKSLFIPAYCGHGFLSLENDSTILYAQDKLYNPAIEKTLRFDDQKAAVRWPGNVDEFILSERDKTAEFLDRHTLSSWYDDWKIAGYK